MIDAKLITEAKLILEDYVANGVAIFDGGGLHQPRPDIPSNYCKVCGLYSDSVTGRELGGHLSDCLLGRAQKWLAKVGSTVKGTGAA